MLPIAIFVVRAIGNRIYKAFFLGSAVNESSVQYVP